MTAYPRSDSQRGKVYSAERAAFQDSAHAAPITPAEVTALVHRAHGWLAEQGFGGGLVHERHLNIDFPGHGHGGAWANPYGSMSFTPGSRRPWVVLHECAHLVMLHRHPDFDGDHRGHGWVFCDIYLRLVRRFLGVAAYTTLRDEFKARRVRYRPKRKVTNTRPPVPPRRERATEVWVAVAGELADGQILYRSVASADRVVVNARTGEARDYRPSARNRNIYWCGDDFHHGVTLDPRRALWRVSRASLENHPNICRGDIIEARSRSLVDNTRKDTLR